MPFCLKCSFLITVFGIVWNGNFLFVFWIKWFSHIFNIFLFKSWRLFKLLVAITKTTSKFYLLRVAIEKNKNVGNTFKVDNKDTRKTSLTCSFVFTVNFEDISHFCFAVEFEQINFHWAGCSTTGYKWEWLTWLRLQRARSAEQ